MVSSHIFTQWGWLIPFCPDDFPGQHKRRWKRAHILFLTHFSSRTQRHEESTSNLWTFVSQKSILHHSFNPPRPTAPRRFKLDVKFRLRRELFQFMLWFQQLVFCFDYSDSILVLTTATVFLLNYLQLFSSSWDLQQKGSFIRASIKALLKLINILTFLILFSFFQYNRR